MTDFMDFHQTPRDIRIDTSYAARPASDYPDYQPEPRRQSQSRIRDVTWISTSQSQQPSTARTPQTPRWTPPPPSISVPTPPADHPRTISRPPTESDWLDAEYMTVTVGGEIEGERRIHEFQEDGMVDPEMGYGFSEEKKGGARKFVGGFVSGLKRLPMVMSKGRLKDRKNPRQGTTHTVDLDRDPSKSSLPRYQSNTQLKPGLPTSNVQYVEAMDMPNPERAHQHPISPRMSLNENGSARAATPLGDMRRERLTLSAVREHSLEHQSDDHQGLGLELNTPHHAFHPSAEALASPVLASPKPGSDYAKMESPIRPPSDTSLGSQFARVQRFIRELNELPWVASRVAAEYIPGESSRARYSRHRDSKPSVSWYNVRHNRSLDLLAGPSIAHPHPHHIHPHHSHHPPYVMGSSANLLYPHGHAPADRSRTPSAEGPPSQQGSTDSHGNPVYPHHAYVPAYVAQPLFVYPSGFPSHGVMAGLPQGIMAGPPQGIIAGLPQGIMGGPPHGVMASLPHGQVTQGIMPGPPPAVTRVSSSSSGSVPDMQQARPVYMLATSPPTFMPPPQDRRSPSRSTQQLHHPRTPIPG